MITIICKFWAEGEIVKKTAILSDDLRSLSQNKKNECYDTQLETYGDGYWSIFFEGEPGTQYEVEFKFDRANRQMTLEPIKAITWINDIIEDVQTVEVTIK